MPPRHRSQQAGSRPRQAARGWIFLACLVRPDPVEGPRLLRRRTRAVRAGGWARGGDDGRPVNLSGVPGSPGGSCQVGRGEIRGRRTCWLPGGLRLRRLQRCSLAPCSIALALKVPIKGVVAGVIGVALLVLLSCSGIGDTDNSPTMRQIGPEILVVKHDEASLFVSASEAGYCLRADAVDSSSTACGPVDESSSLVVAPSIVGGSSFIGGTVPHLASRVVVELSDDSDLDVLLAGGEHKLPFLCYLAKLPDGVEARSVIALDAGGKKVFERRV